MLLFFVELLLFLYLIYAFFITLFLVRWKYFIIVLDKDWVFIKQLYFVIK